MVVMFLPATCGKASDEMICAVGRITPFTIIMAG
jgi:hypothetical protein